MTAVADRPIVEMLLPRPYASKRAVIEAIGRVMIDASAVTRDYVDGMFRKELEASTLVTEDVALPHGTADVRNAVLRNILVIVPILDGVEWLPAKRVRLAIGFAGTGDKAHLRLLGSVARVLTDDVTLDRLKSGSITTDVAALFSAERHQ
jgi:mannitol/fructose-specific phosphotransferase system IIA component